MKDFGIFLCLKPDEIEVKTSCHAHLINAVLSTKFGSQVQRLTLIDLEMKSAHSELFVCFAQLSMINFTSIQPDTMWWECENIFVELLTWAWTFLGWKLMNSQNAFREYSPECAHNVTYLSLMTERKRKKRAHNEGEVPHRKRKHFSWLREKTVNTTLLCW